MSVATDQRFTRRHPCPVCGGGNDEPQGNGTRCWGFLSGDGEYAHCTREEHAGNLSEYHDGTYVHRLTGDCDCGVTHDARPRATPVPKRDRGRVVREVRYEARDPDGSLAAVKIRREYADGLKVFVWQQPDGTAGLNGRSSVDMPLYSIEQLQRTKYGVVTEGEKAQQALASLSIPAVGTMTGAKSIPSDAVLATVAHLPKIALWPDNDADGARHMERIAARLVALGAADVRIVQWPDAPPRGDAADFIAAGADRAAVLALLRQSRPWEAAHAESTRPPAANTITLDAVQPEVVSWLWPGRIPLGKLVIFDGDPGLGKSLMSLDVAARVSAGKPMPDGTLSDLDGPATVVLVSVEDGLADTIRPRLDLAGADTSRIVAITSVTGADGHERPVVLPDDWPHIEAVVRAHNARLVIGDPLMALLGSDVNSYRDQDARRALLPGVQMAERTGAALLVIRHLNKGAGSSAIYRGGGSIGIAGAARSVLLVAKDPDDETESRRIVASVKNNLAAPAPALAYRVESGANGHPYLVWEGATDHTANQLLAMLSDDRGERRDAVEEAVSFLEDALGKGPRPTRDVLRDARAHGISEAAVRRARKTLGITAQKSGFGGDGPWCLTLPDHPKAFTESQRRSSQNVNTFGEVERLCTPDQAFCTVCNHLLPTAEDRERGAHARCLNGATR